MGLFDFVKSAGAKLFGNNNEELQNAIASSIQKNGIEVQDLQVTCDDDCVTLKGRCGTHETCEKAILIAGNTNGIAKVNNQIAIDASLAPQAAVLAQAPSRFHTVQSGDTLSKISKEVYGDPMKYGAIFEANRPMLENPDKIYPGQVLRIPEQTTAIA